MARSKREEEIENIARRLLADIWRKRDALWDKEPSPLEAIDLEVIARHLGYRIDEHESLGRFAGGKIETAGAIDQNRRIISISRKFKEETRRFTTAHEIGHLVLHPEQTVMHRDLPTKEYGDEKFYKDPMEKEANYFSACLLMPPRLLTKEFTRRFGKPPFHFNENVCHKLSPDNPEALLYADEDSLIRESTLVTTEYLDGLYIPSLAKSFKVSVSAMARRIKELELVKCP